MTGPQRPDNPGRRPAETTDGEAQSRHQGPEAPGVRCPDGRRSRLSSSSRSWMPPPTICGSPRRASPSWTQQSAFFGIMAVPVGLLMIGGEFDLSTGHHDRGHRHSDGPSHRQAPLERLGRHRRDPRLCHDRRPGQRPGGRQDQTAQLHRHAGDVLCAPGRQHWLCPARQPGQYRPWT